MAVPAPAAPTVAHLNGNVIIFEMRADLKIIQKKMDVHIVYGRAGNDVTVIFSYFSVGLRDNCVDQYT